MPLRTAREPPSVLYSDSHLRLEWLPDLRATLNTWTGFLQGDEYRLRMDHCLEVVARVSACAVLANVQALRPLLVEDQDWTNIDWAPRAVAAGLRHMAVVVPKSLFAQLPVTRVVRKLGDVSMNTALFDEPADALGWLETLDR